MSEGNIEFDYAFQALTGNAPFPWQQALYQKFIAGEFPASCNLPTGLGKTSVIPIWLLALASAPELVPRRLVYVVNRRTVVDQATREAETMRDRLAGLSDLSSRLGTLCSIPADPPLAISTLRGQFADNAEWRIDPARPAVVVGTVDMIGSRLLFSGYGCGFKSRPLHAGFLGQDVLLIHDEAHLEPAFQSLLMSIQKEQNRSHDLCQFNVMELTATSRGSGEQFGLTDDEQSGKVPAVRKRLHAKKTIRMHPCADDKRLAEHIAKLALIHKESQQAIVVFVRTLEDVGKVVARLHSEKQLVEQLTGTMRGLERDRLATHNSIFARFLPQPQALPQEGTVYLVCTSAGEVGVNISADHLICDLSPFDSMAQRFGRVNRFGDGDAAIDVVHPTSFDAEDLLDARREMTLRLLSKLRGDASPAALGRLPAADRQAAFTPPPAILEASDILFDAWSLTSIREPLPGRPLVADFLHGIAPWQPPSTFVVWRQEVEWVTAEHLSALDPQELLDDYPLKPHELLRDRTANVLKHLTRLAQEHATAPVWLAGRDSIQVATLGELIAAGRDALNEATVLLPPSVGGLTKSGLLGSDEPSGQLDVADELRDEEGQLRRQRFVMDSTRDTTPPTGMRLVRSIALEPPDDPGEHDLEGPAATREWRWYVRPWSADDDGSKSAQHPQELGSHQQAASHYASKLVAGLRLAATEASAVVLAARWHDLGKHRQVWQKSIGNLKYPTIVLAKSGGRMRPVELSAYRHEFGSLLDVHREAQFNTQTNDVKELILHLIAAHHGRARPHFPMDEAFDPSHSEAATNLQCSEVPRRFSRLQRKYGRWGLAYLESLVRAADAQASANPTESGQ